jgi:gluconolactonase
MLTEAFEVLDERFAHLAMGNVHLEQLWNGCRWAEGPAYFAAGRYLIWSDIPNDRILRWDETDGVVSIFRSPANNTNGHTVDLEGRLVSAEHRTRCVSRTEHDGSRKVLVDRFEGKRLNSPNDLVVKSDGTIWFTDPSYGIDSDYANGIAFSPDESLLYIADTGATNVRNGPRHIRRFAVSAGGTLSGGEVFATCTVGLFDGFRLDQSGNLWTSAGDGVHCFAPDGTLIGKVRVPEVVANVCFGGPKRNRIFICGTTSLYSIYVNAAGALRPRPTDSA